MIGGRGAMPLVFPANQFASVGIRGVRQKKQSRLLLTSGAFMGLSKRRGQKTLKARANLSGIGVHSGKPVSISICPADADSGISFVRTGVPGSPDVEIPARHSAVGSTELCTVLGDPRGVFVATVEHLLAALVGLGIDNATIEIDGAEVPVMDGSAEAFVDAIDRVGIRRAECAEALPQDQEAGARRVWARLSASSGPMTGAGSRSGSPMIAR